MEGAQARDERPRRRRRGSVGESADSEELRRQLRDRAREAERSREQWLRELDDLKRSLRDRVEEVEQREAELAEATRRLEQSRDGRRRRGGHADTLTDRQAELEKLSRELDERAEELERRERDLRRREQRLASGPPGSG